VKLTPPVGSNVVAGEFELRGGFVVLVAGTEVSAGRVVSTTGMVVEVAGIVLLDDVVTEADVEVADATVVDVIRSGATTVFVASSDPINARPPKISRVVTPDATSPVIHAARLPRITSATSELAGAGSP